MSTEDLIHYYIALKREFYKIPMMQTPKPGGKQYEKLKEVAEIIDSLNGDVQEYLLQQVRVFKKRNLFPSPAHLAGQKCIDRYQQWLKLKKLRTGELFLTDKESVCIRKTGLYYDLKMFAGPFEDDDIFIHVSSLVKRGELPEGDLIPLIWEIEYVFAKYEYKNTPVPKKLIDYNTKIRRRW